MQKITINDLSKVLEEVSGKKFPSLNESSFFVKDLDLASISIIDFIFEVEKKFHVGIRLADLFADAKSGAAKQDFTIGDILVLLNKQ